MDWKQVQEGHHEAKYQDHTIEVRQNQSTNQYEMFVNGVKISGKYASAEEAKKAAEAGIKPQQSGPRS